MSWLSNSNPYLPWNWPSDLSKSFVSQLEPGIEFLLHVFLLSILTIIQTILYSFEYMFSSSLMAIVYSFQSLGPLGLPLFTGFFIVAAGISMDLFHFAHDLPIVGDFV